MAVRPQLADVMEITVEAGHDNWFAAYSQIICFLETRKQKMALKLKYRVANLSIS